MKLKNFLGLAAIMLMVSACSDDDNNANETNPVVNVVGTYQGYSEAAFQYVSTPMVSDGETLTIAANADNTTATVTYTSGSFGEFTIDDVTVTYASDTYTLSGSGSTLMGMGGSSSEYPCTFEGTLNGSRTEGSLVFTVPGVMGGMTITFTLGDAPLSKLLAGSHTGWTDAACAYFDSYGVTEDETFTLTSTGDKTFSLAYTSETWGSFTFDAVTATATASGYSFSGEGVCAMGMGGSTSEYPCTVEGNLSADRESGVITFNVPGVMGGLTITFTLGDAPAAGNE